MQSEFQGKIANRDYSYVVDLQTSIIYSRYNFSCYKYAQQGLLGQKEAFQSPLVNKIRCFYLVKMMIFSVALQTLVYSPQVLLFIFIAIELFYLIGSAIKYWTIKHFVSKFQVIHLMLQSLFLVVFLSLVGGMTFKE